MHWALSFGWNDLLCPAFFWIDLWLTLLAVAAVATAFEWRRRRGRGRQLSLSEFLALVAVAGLAAGWAARIREGSAIVAALGVLHESPSPMLETPGPKWLEQLWSEDRLLRRGWFQMRADGESKGFDFPKDPEERQALQFLLDRYGDQLVLRVHADASLEQVARLKYVRHVWISELQGPTEKLVQVIESFPELRSIHLIGDNIDDSVFVALARNSKLESIWAGETEVTERGLATLGRLPRLEEISVYGCDIRSLAGFESGTFPTLKLLDLSDTPLREIEVETFRRAHPGCEVRHPSEREPGD